MTGVEHSPLASQMLEALEADLRAATAMLEMGPYAEMAEMVAHHFGWGEGDSRARGKRIRPLLALLCCGAAGGVWQDALPAASAVELIHNFSLAHDDIQDESPERRGRPTLWARWGVPQAINTGDALLVLARLSTFRLRASGHTEATVLEVQRTLDEACLHLTKGQHLDLVFEGRERVTVEEYLEMIEGKTGALVAAATTAGAALAHSAPRIVEAYRDFGRHLGLAFQILDDVLGIWGAPEVTGKPAGDDLKSRKKTLPVLFGLENSAPFRRLWSARSSGKERLTEMRSALEGCGALEHARAAAAAHTDRALDSLERAHPQGAEAAELRDLARRLLQRDA
jgi:geranylgeranyl diphosphate synthase type I